MKFFTRNDILIVIAAFAIVILFVFPRGKASSFAEVYHDGRLVRTIDLSSDSEIFLDVGMVVKVQDGRISVIDSDCPEKLCVSQGAISMTNIPIVCVPNRTLIKIVSSQFEVDAITQ
ncbi:MAG: NusG domain II-containing protein [Kosmotogaceae bacterium]|nr:NusG domain II-containing protein [Kosmotogaceae bacterium]